MDAKEIVDKYRQYLYGLGTYYKEPLPFVKGEGKWLFDAAGRVVAQDLPNAAAVPLEDVLAGDGSG